MFPMGTKAFSSFAYFGGFFLFPLLMEQVYGYSVSQVGFISVARPLIFAISAPIAGYMTVRTGERTATLFGTGSLLLSMILFATLSRVGRAVRHPGGAGPVGPRHGRLHAGHVGDHVQRAGGVGVRRHERSAAAGHPGRRSGRHPGGPDDSGVDRPHGQAWATCITARRCCTASASRSGSAPASPRWRWSARCSSGRCPARRGRRSGWPTPADAADVDAGYSTAAIR